MGVDGEPMDDRQKIQDRLKKKEQEIQALEERLRTARTYVQALQDIMKLLNCDDPLPSAGGSRAGLRTGSAVDQARKIILQHDSPVHISVLAEAIGQDTREARISLASSLAAYVRKGEIFTRTAPNTFGLIELGHKTTKGDDEGDGPPSGFGTIKRVQSAPAPSPAVAQNEVDDEIPF